MYINISGLPEEARLEELLSLLVSEPSPAYVDTFLLNLHTLTSSKDLLLFFESVCNEWLASNGDGSGGAGRNSKANGKTKVHCVLDCLDKWVDRYWAEDFEAHEDVIELVNSLLRKLPAEDATAVRIRSRVTENAAGTTADRTQSSNPGKKIPDQPPKPELLPASSSRAMSMLNFSPLELARQLTLIDSHIYRKIRRREAMGQAWAKTGASKRAANVLHAIDRFNKTSAWVATEILRSDSNRLATLCHSIEVAHCLYQLRNFQSLMAMLGGLGASSISRLKSLWNAVPNKYQEMYAEVQQVMALTSNMKPLRTLLARCASENGGEAAIPYVGLYLGDLIFIDEGNPDNVSVDNGSSDGSVDAGDTDRPPLVNFSKRQQFADTIDDLLRFQQFEHNFVPIAFIQEYLEEGTLPLTEDDAYRLSLFVQGRGGGAGAGAAGNESGDGQQQRKKATSFEHEHVEGSVFYDRTAEPVLFDQGADDNVSGSLLGILVNITNENQSDDFGGTRRNAVLQMYKAVTTPRVLLELLAMRYAVPPPKSSLSQEKLELYKNKFVKPIHQRIAAFLQFWLGKHWDDFARDPGALAALRLFVTNCLVEPYMEGLATMLMSICDAKEKEQRERARADGDDGSGDGEGSVSSDSSSDDGESSGSNRAGEGVGLGSRRRRRGVKHDQQQLLLLQRRRGEAHQLRASQAANSSHLHNHDEHGVADEEDTGSLNAEAVARELAYRHHQAFGEVHAAELLHCESEEVWTNEGLVTKKAPESLRPLLAQFFATQRWAQRSVLSLAQRHARAARIGWFLDVAEHCFDCRAHSPAAALAAALSDGLLAPGRLTETWDLVPLDQVRRLRTLVRIFSSSADFAAYRNHMRAIIAPCVPLLAPDTKDMMAIASTWGQMTVSKCDRKTVIQFAAWLKAAPTVVDIAKFQRSAFTFPRDLAVKRRVARLIKHARALSESQMNDLGEACVQEERATSHLSPFEREIRAVTLAAMENPDVQLALRPLIDEQTAAGRSVHTAAVEEANRKALENASHQHETATLRSILNARRLATRAGAIVELLDNVDNVGQLLSQCLPGGHLDSFEVEDNDGLVLGWPDQISLHVYSVPGDQEASQQYVVSFVRVLSSPSQLVSALRRLELFITNESKTVTSSPPQALIVTVHTVSDKLLQLANKHKIKVLLVK